MACPNETMITPFWVSVGGERCCVRRRRWLEAYDYHAIWKLRRALQVADGDAC